MPIGGVPDRARHSRSDATQAKVGPAYAGDMGREGKRVTKTGHVFLHAVQLPDDLPIDDPKAVAKFVARSWPLWQRVLFGRLHGRVIAGLITHQQGSSG
jgi:hypothetical protein